MNATTAMVQASAPAPIDYSREQLDIIKRSVAPELNDIEFAFFIEVAKRRRLDPFINQIFARKHNTQRGPRVTHMTSIDAFRCIAQRSGEYEGQTPVSWCGEDGVWKDAWLDQKPPVAAKVGVYRKGFREPCWAVARYAAYIPQNEREQFMWKRMPELMIGKCAEALAIRKAFPEDTSDLYTPDEMGQAVAPEAVTVTVEQAKPSPAQMAAAQQTNLQPMAGPVAKAVQAAGGTMPSPPPSHQESQLELMSELLRNAPTPQEREAVGLAISKAHKAGKINDAERAQLASLYRKLQTGS